MKQDTAGPVSAITGYTGGRVGKPESEEGEGETQARREQRQSEITQTNQHSSLDRFVVKTIP